MDCIAEYRTGRKGMTPRFLRCLRIDDHPPYGEDDIASQLKLRIEDLTRWYDFCKQLADPTHNLGSRVLSIDCNFQADTSGRWFPWTVEHPERYDEFASDPDCVTSVGRTDLMILVRIPGC